MTKTERIQMLEKLLAELSYRVYKLEVDRYRIQTIPQWVGPYTYYSATGMRTNLGSFTSSPSTGGVQAPHSKTTTGLASDSGRFSTRSAGPDTQSG